MKAIRYKIIVIEEDIKMRLVICNWLSNAGYAVFECKDSYKALRLVRRIMPDLVILPSYQKNLNMKLFIEIVESGNLSYVFLLAKSENDALRRLLCLSTLKLYGKIPLDRNVVLNQIKKSLMTVAQLKKQNQRERRKNHNDENSKTLETAKQILMDMWHINEDQAYIHIRKKSMDSSLPIQEIASKIIESKSNL